MGKAAYGADRTCQSLRVKGAVAVRYRPRAPQQHVADPYREGVCPLATGLQVVPQRWQRDLAVGMLSVEGVSFFLFCFLSLAVDTWGREWEWESDQHCLAQFFLHGLDFRYWRLVLTDVADDSEK